MTEGWALCKLEDFVRFRNGKSIKAGTHGAYPVYGSNGIIGSSDDFMYGDAIILGRVGAYCGSVERSFGRFWASDNTIVVEADDSTADTQFVYYLLLDAGLNRHAGGAAQPLLTQSRLKPLEFLLPPIPTQQRIAAILSAYDDLIENNTRRIAILEEMARRLYEEWFVHFRFPGHEEAAFKKRPISEVADVVRGRSYKSSELVAEGGRPFVNLKCVNRDGGFRRDGLKRYEGRFKDQQLVKRGDIVMAVTDMTQERRIVARAALVPELGEIEGLISMDLVKIVPQPSTSKVFLYAALRWSCFADNVKNHATGANVLHLHPDRISDYLMPLPPMEHQHRFAVVVAPMVDEIELLEQKNANLRAQRDLLLPKLVSGEIDVNGAEAELEAAE